MIKYSEICEGVESVIKNWQTQNSFCRKQGFNTLNISKEVL